MRFLPCRYGELQQPQISSQMNAIQVPDAQQDEIDTVLSVMQLSVPQAVQVGFATPLISICTDSSLSPVSRNAVELGTEAVK